MALQDSIQNILALMQIIGQQRQGQAQLGLQERQLASQQAAQKASSQNDLLLGLLPALRSMPNSEAAGPFLESIAGRTGLDADFLLNFAQSVAPTLEAQTSGAARTGRATAAPERVAKQNEAAADQVTGFNPLQAGIDNFLLGALNSVEGDPGITRAAVLRQLTGMAPGEYATSQAMAGLPQQDLTNAARVGLDLQVGAGGQLSAATAMRGQDLGYASSMANNRLGWAELAQRGAHQELEMQVRQQIGMLEAYGKNTLGMNDLPELAGTAARLSENLQKARDPLTRQQDLAMLGMINQLLNRQFGVATPQINALGDLSETVPMYPGFTPQRPGLPTQAPVPTNPFNQPSWSPWRR